MIKTHPCKNDCGSNIYFDPEFKTDAGKWIPMDAQTHEAHQCPNAPNRPQQQQQHQPKAPQQEGVIIRLERMEAKVDSILSHLNLNKKLMEAEQQYDTEREDGTLGGDKW